MEVQSRFDAEQSAAEALELRRRLDALEERQQKREAGIGSFFPNWVTWLPCAESVWMRGAAFVALLLGVVTLWRGKSIVEWIEHLREAAIVRALDRAGVIDRPDEPV
ncbi:MAG TPA: hypothetical protein VFC57_07660 [Aeromicrobium sp.]|nr:hypothetical protein [Aeromicrobium sp.]